MIDRNLKTIPETDLTEKTLLSHWELVTKLHQHFWQRWQRDYLNQLKQRPKWAIRRNNLQKGDLVLISDAKLPSNKWPLVIIIPIFPQVLMVMSE